MSKKEIIPALLLLLLFSHSPVFSQLTIDLIHNSKRTGDAIEMYKIETDDIWNLSNSDKCGDVVYEKNEDFKQDSITVLFNGTRRYYEYRYDSLLYVALENSQNMESYYFPETSCIFPMTLGDKHSGILASHIIYCDKLILQKFGTYTVHADSIGSLTLRNGNTIDNALQISCRREYMYEQLDSCDLDSIPQYTKEEISGKLSTGTGIYTEVERNIYLKGYRYPIIKNQELYNPEGDLCLTETYYSPPEEQEVLYLDEPNLEARREHSSYDDVPTLDESVDVFSYVNKRPGSMEVVFDIESFLAEYPQSGTIQCRLLLSDGRGIIYRTRGFSVDSSMDKEVSLSYSGLKHGHYVLSVVIDNKIYTDNFIVD